jgi:fucose 4-O-acetylase-like acetyltransferase
MRNRDLDIYRGLLMMYIVSFIHVLYWDGLFMTTYKSIFLFETPVIFFITGATYELNKKKKYLDFWKRRLERILIPYLTYCVVPVAGSYILSIIINTRTDLSFLIPFLDWHIWFIPTYLLVVIFIPFLYLVFDKVKPYVRCVLPVSICLILYYFDHCNLFLHGPISYIRYILFYSFCVYVGFGFNRSEYQNIPSVIYMAILFMAVALCYGGYYCGMYTRDMQINKFPPNLMFVTFNVAWFCMLVLMKPIFLKMYSLPLLTYCIKVFSQYSLTIYLFHPIAFLIMLPINKYLLRAYINDLYIPITICESICILFISMVVPKLIGKVEQVTFRDIGFSIRSLYQMMVSFRMD